MSRNQAWAAVTADLTSAFDLTPQQAVGLPQHETLHRGLRASSRTHTTARPKLPTQAGVFGRQPLPYRLA